MAAIITNAFGGERPVTQPRLLSDSESQLARNVRLVSGRIEPLKGTSVLAGVSLAANATTIFRYGNSDTETNYWMSWANRVHAVRSPIANDQYDRLYWTGEGSGVTLFPRYAPNSILLGTPPYPSASYRLGIPKPTATVTASGTAVVNPTVVTREYVITYTNGTSPTLESLPSKVYTVSAIDGGDVVFSNLPDSNEGDTRTTHKRIYRKLSGTYRLITTLALAEATYTDSMTDATLASQAALNPTIAGAITSPASAPRASAASGSGVTEATETRSYFITVTSGRFTILGGDGGQEVVTFDESYSSAAINVTNVYQKQSVSLSGFSVPAGLTYSMYRIYRKRGSETAFQLIGEAPAGTTSFTDNAIEPTTITPYGGASYVNSENKPSFTTATAVTPYSPTTTSQSRVYCVTFVNSSGVESAASPDSNAVTVIDGNTVTISHSESLPTGVTLKRIYRKQQNEAATAYRRLVEIQASQTSHTDTASASSISGNATLPAGLQNLLAKPTETPTIEGKIPAKKVPESRTYVFTFVSEYGEEGPPSSASTVISIDPELPVTVDTNTVAQPTPTSGSYRITTKRIYRSSTVGNQAQFQFVADVPVATENYTDSKTQADLGEVLPSEGWEPPPDKLHNLRMMANGIACGFVKDGVDRTVVLSEPYLPHAWNPEYSFTTDDVIVGMGVFRQSIAVLTKSYPYIIYGVDPSAMSMTRLELQQACASEKSIVETGDGVLYASPDGLISISGGGAQNITQNLFTREQWQDLNPSSMQCFFHDSRVHIIYNRTIAPAEMGMLILDLSGQGAVLTRSNINATTAIAGGYYDARTDTLYFIQGGSIVRHNRGSDLTYLWRSKLFKAPYPMNFSCAQVLAETYPVTLNVFADGSQKMTKSVANANIFTLPSGFRAQDWYYEVTGTSKVYSVSVAQSYAEIKST